MRKLGRPTATSGYHRTVSVRLDAVDMHDVTALLKPGETLSDVLRRGIRALVREHVRTPKNPK